MSGIVSRVFALKHKMSKDGEPSSFSIRRSREDDIDFCLSLERELHPDLTDAVEQGFLLQGASAEQYREFLDGGYFLIAEHNGEPVGFVVALPKSHPRIKVLFGLREMFSVESEDVFELDGLVWIAKIAVKRSIAHQGCGKALASALEKEIGNRPLMTATLLEPVSNVASKRLCESLGFRVIGSFDGGDHGELKNCKNAVYLRMPPNPGAN